jgi:hypothetical protein
LPVRACCVTCTWLSSSCKSSQPAARCEGYHTVPFLQLLISFVEEASISTSTNDGRNPPGGGVCPACRKKTASGKRCHKWSQKPSSRLAIVFSLQGKPVPLPPRSKLTVCGPLASYLRLLSLSLRCLWARLPFRSLPLLAGNSRRMTCEGA